MNVFRKNNIVDGLVVSIKLILMLFAGYILGIVRRLRFEPKLKFLIAEYISNKIGYEFNPEWVSWLLTIFAYCIILILFISEGFLSNLFKKKPRSIEISTPYQKNQKRKNK